MLPYFDYQAINCVQAEKLRNTQPNPYPTCKLRHRLCGLVGAWMITLGERLTAVVPQTPTTTELELA